MSHPYFDKQGAKVSACTRPWREIIIQKVLSELSAVQLKDICKKNEGIRDH